MSAAAAVEDEVYFCKDAVYIHTTQNRVDDPDALIKGRLYLRNKGARINIEWEPVQQTHLSFDTGDFTNDDWAVVNSVGYKPREENGSGIVELKAVPRSRIHINFDIRELKCFKMMNTSASPGSRHRHSRQYQGGGGGGVSGGQGWEHLTFILKDGTTHPQLHFCEGGIQTFINALQAYVCIRRSSKEKHLYLVTSYDAEAEALEHSLNAFDLFSGGDGGVGGVVGGVGQHPHIVSKFISDPVHTTLGGFSKVTKFLMDNIVTPVGVGGAVVGAVGGPLASSRPEDEMADILRGTSMLEQYPGFAVRPAASSQQDEDHEYELVTCTELPARSACSRGPPLSAAQWSQHMDGEGRVTRVRDLHHTIFRGGVDPALRNEVWKYLLSYYPYNSTAAERKCVREFKTDSYYRMKQQWKSISADQESRFSALRQRKELIEKDVHRTDRTLPYFEGEHNMNISLLSDILTTYVMYNFDLGYVQGMSDMLAPVLVVIENEPDTFWCFVALMDRLAGNFDLSQEKMKNELEQLYWLLRFFDTDFCNYLDSVESSNMFICFRWLLIMFKREFTLEDTMRLWEILWTDLPCPNFHLLICLAILDTAKVTIMENQFTYDKILKHINDMSGDINVNECVSSAEGMYNQLMEYAHTPHANIPHNIVSIFHLPSQQHSRHSHPHSQHSEPHSQHSQPHSQHSQPLSQHSEQQTAPHSTHNSVDNVGQQDDAGAVIDNKS